MANLLDRLDVRDFASQFARNEGSAENGVDALTLSSIETLAEWQRAFSHLRKDSRYYQIVEETICSGFSYKYLVLKEADRVRSIQPYFLLDQDLLQAAPPTIKTAAGLVRRVWPGFLMLRTLMVGSPAGEAHLPVPTRSAQQWHAKLLSEQLASVARAEQASLIVLKEFPAQYRDILTCFLNRGFARIASMPMTRLELANYSSFEDYLQKAIKGRRRTEFRKKFKASQQLGAIELKVLNDVTPLLDEIYPLYVQVYERAPLKFEKLSKSFFAQLGQRMPDKARFFVWRLNGKCIAFSLCLVEGDRLYGEYLGLDYAVALKLNLYFLIMRDTIAWAIENGFSSILSSGLNYAPKLQMRHVLEPIDLYVRHVSPIANAVLKLVLPLVEPARNNAILKRFPNYRDLWEKPGKVQR